MAERSVEELKREMHEYFDEQGRRFPRYARRAAAIKSEERYSVEWFAELGSYLKDLRQLAQLTREEAAERNNISVNLLRFAEVGMAEPDDFPAIEQYLHTLGGEQLLADFNHRFRFQSHNNTL